MATASWMLPKPALPFLCWPILFGGGMTVADAILRDTRLHAQGVTTAAISGTVRMADGSDPEGARVIVRNTATGYVLDAEVRRGSFLVQGLEAGGLYTILVRRIGALARRWDGVILTLGEPGAPRSTSARRSIRRRTTSARRSTATGIGSSS